MQSANPRYDYAINTVPAPSGNEGGGDACAYADAAGMARELIRFIVLASGNDMETCLMVMRRAMGMTYDEIGALSGMSHIAVRKRLKKVVRSHPEMAEYMDPVSLDWSMHEELERLGMFRTPGGQKRKALRKKGKAKTKKKGHRPSVPVVARPDGRRMVQPLLLTDEE